MKILKNLLIVVPSLGIGGQEKIAIDTATHLKDKFNTKIVIFHSSKNGEEYKAPCKVETLNVSVKKGIVGKLYAQLVRAYKLKRIRNSFAADFVYSFGDTANITNILSSFGKGKSVLAIHHGIKNEKKNIFRGYIYRKADAVISISESMTCCLKKMYPYVEKFVTIQNGYDIETIKKLAVEDEVVLDGNPIFITVGRHEYVKGYHRLIKAFSNVSSDYPNAKLYMVGEGSLTNELKDLANKLHVSKEIVFLGYQRNPYRYMKAADVLVLSSYSEGLPNSVIEGLACNLMIVASDCGANEILQSRFSTIPTNGVKYTDYGVLIDNTGDEAFIESLSKLMKVVCQDQALVKKYKQSGCDRADNYSIDNYCDNLIKLFDSLMENVL